MPVPLRADFDATQLRSFARKTKDGPQARRLLALASIYDGATRTEAAKIGGGDAADRAGLGDEIQRQGCRKKALGQPSKLADAHRAALVKVIDEGPIPAIHGVVRWRLIDLCQ